MHVTQSQRHPEILKVALALLFSFAFGFGVWCALVLGLASRACTPGFNLSAATTWLVLYTIFGFVYWVPVAIVFGGTGYFVTSRMGLLGRPVVVSVASLLVLAVIFGLGVLFSHQGRCIMP